MKSIVVKNRIVTLLAGLFLLAGLLLFPAQLILAAPAEDASENIAVCYKDGLYRGVGYGISSKVILEVLVEDGKIAQITEVSQTETPAFWERALAMFERIIDSQSLDVDVVTGATLSSEAIREAVGDALKQAEMTADEQAAYHFEGMITALPELEGLTLEDASAVEAARSAYSALTEAQRQLVPDAAMEKLAALEEKLAALSQPEEPQENPTPTVPESDVQVPEERHEASDQQQSVKDAAAVDTKTSQNVKTGIPEMGNIGAALVLCGGAIILSVGWLQNRPRRN
ncbi:MAG: FMN-binding protein [Eubacterium sp.]|nr:FMN-binding protein [Eubacterium sp.]